MNMENCIMVCIYFHYNNVIFCIHCSNIAAVLLFEQVHIISLENFIMKDIDWMNFN